MVKLSDIIKLGYQKRKEEEKKEKTGQDVSKDEKPEVQAKQSPLLQKPAKSTSDTHPPKSWPEKTSDNLKLSKAFKHVTQEKIEVKEKTAIDEAKVLLSTMMKSMEEEKKNTKVLYKKGLLILKNIFEKIEVKEDFDIAELAAFIKEIVDEMAVGKKELIKLALITDFDNSLWQHSFNTCILSINIGLSLGYNKIKLNELGLSACLYDCGLVEIKDLVEKPKKVSADELTRIKKHPGRSAKLLEKIGKNIPDIVKKVTLQHHERVNGSGYPKGIKGEDIHEYAQIIGLVDHYESLTHPRPYRESISSHQAIKTIITKQAQCFDNFLLKALIKKMSLYPIGSWVQLNTKEVAKAIEINEDFPMRPVVRVLFDSTGKRLDEIKTLDLSKNQNIYIEKIVTLEKLSTRISIK